MPLKCSIEFDNLMNIFYVGQIIKGTVKIELKKEQQLSNVYVRFYGDCTVKLNRDRNQETYLDVRIYLLGDLYNCQSCMKMDHILFNKYYCLNKCS